MSCVIDGASVPIVADDTLSETECRVILDRISDAVCSLEADGLLASDSAKEFVARALIGFGGVAVYQAINAPVTPAEHEAINEWTSAKMLELAALIHQRHDAAEGKASS